jgi:nucleotide-binding universal stress UspA family protein
MYHRILVPIDLADPNLAKPAIESAVMMADSSDGLLRLINVLPMTPVMLAEYVPPDFEVQQRASAEEALKIVSKETGLPPARVTSIVRQGGIYHEILKRPKR